MSEVPGSANRRRQRWPLAAAALALAIVVLVGVVAVNLTATLLSDAWRRGRIDVVARFTGGEVDPSWPYLDAQDRTAQVCAPPVNCVQAVGNEYLTLLKFSNVEEARRYAETLGPNGHQIDPLVLHFNGTAISPHSRRDHRRRQRHQRQQPGLSEGPRPRAATAPSNNVPNGANADVTTDPQPRATSRVPVGTTSHPRCARAVCRPAPEAQTRASRIR